MTGYDSPQAVHKHRDLSFRNKGLMENLHPVCGPLPEPVDAVVENLVAGEEPSVDRRADVFLGVTIAGVSTLIGIGLIILFA